MGSLSNSARCQLCTPTTHRTRWNHTRSPVDASPEEQRRVVLVVSAPLLRLQQGEEADVVERLDGLGAAADLRGLGAIPNSGSRLSMAAKTDWSITLLK